MINASHLLKLLKRLLEQTENIAAATGDSGDKVTGAGQLNLQACLAHLGQASVELTDAVAILAYPPEEDEEDEEDAREIK